MDNGQLRPIGVKVGEIVLYGAYSGSEIEIDGKPHLQLREEEILGVIEP